MKTTALVVSLLGNMALVSALLADAPAVRMEPPLDARAACVAREPSSMGAIEFANQRRLALAELEERELSAIENPWDHFWQPGDPSLHHALAVRSAYERIRAELERRFGADAARAPELARAFRPLDAEARFLSSSEQLELQRRRLDVHVEEIAGRLPAAPLPPVAEVSLDFLMPAAARELRLRSSPLAQLLRGSGAALDEHEFRAVFALLDRGGTRPDLSQELRMREGLRDLLGPQRAAAVFAVRDPLWPVVQRTAAELGLDSAAAAAAYTAASEAQQALLELAARGARDGSAGAVAGAIAETERDRLIAALGENGAATLIAARAAMRPRAAD